MRSSLFTFVFLCCFWALRPGNLAYGAPSDPENYDLIPGGLMDLSEGSVVEGSVSRGGIQPDYVIDLESPAMRSLRQYARKLRSVKMPFWKRVRELSALVADQLPGRSYTDETYRVLLQSYRDRGLDIPLSRYASCGVGVCREYGMMLHLVLKEAGIPSYYVYAKVRHPPVEEDHGFAVVRHQGKNWVVDAYSPNYNGYQLEDLMHPRRKGAFEKLSPLVDRAYLRDFSHGRILKLRNYPKVWVPKTAAPSRSLPVQPGRSPTGEVRKCSELYGLLLRLEQ